MSRWTQTERMLLESLETQAARMKGIGAMIEILTDWGIYEEDSVCDAARRERRQQAGAMLEGMARHYHDEAMRMVEAAYQGDG